ncbi:hypothetical protein [Natrialba magadii]
MHCVSSTSFHDTLHCRATALVQRCHITRLAERSILRQ